MENVEIFFGAIRNGNLDQVRSLLEANSKLINAKDGRGSTPLVLATYYNQEAIAKLLLEQGAAINATDGSDNTALMGVCFKGYFDLAKLLLEAGAEVNHRNSMGATSLIYAATFNKLRNCQIAIGAWGQLNTKRCSW